MKVFQYGANMCDVKNGTTPNMAINILFKVLYPYTNFLDGCPYVAVIIN